MKKRWTVLLCLAAALVLTACAAGEGSVPHASAGNGGGAVSAPEAPAGSAGTEEDSTGTASDAAGTEAPGLLSSFSTTDLEGGAVDQSILEGCELTLVNIWATYCGPCLNEMPDLGELAAEYADQGVQILGLVSDVLNSDGTLSDSQLELAREIVAETGADYRHLVPSADLYGLLSQIYAVPTTFFVDSEGNQVGYAYMTAMSYDQFVEIIDAALAEVTA